MPEWMHNRAEHILAKNPSMPKGEAFAIATQQMHALGKSPKGYGTSEGRHTAKAKYDTPKDDKKTANPGGLESPKMEKKSFNEALLEEMEALKEAGVLQELWHAANKPIPGTPELFSGRLGNLLHSGVEAAKPLASKTKDQVLASRRASYRPKAAQFELQSPDPAQKVASTSSLLDYDPNTTRAQEIERESDRLEKKDHIYFPKTPAGSAQMEASEKGPSGKAELPLMKAAFTLALDVYEKTAGDFQVSQYSGPLSYGSFKMTSGLPNKAPPSLQDDPTKKQAGAMTPSGLSPAARLSSSMQIGAPKLTAPAGPSIADVAKPNGPGFGSGIAGAFKTTIGGTGPVGELK